MMKNSKNADVEIAAGVGATAAALLNAGVITSGGIVTQMIAQAGAATGLTAIAGSGATAAAFLGVIGPVGWAVAGIGGVALILHGAYRGT